MFKRFFQLIVVLIVILNLAGSAQPILAQPINNDQKVQVKLISEVDTIQPGNPFWVAINFEILPDWHLYWRNPGDSGMAPKIDWQLPQGFQTGEIEWATPKRIPVGPLMNFGYENQLNLLTQIIPPKDLVTPSNISISGKVDWLVCKEDCIPEQGNVALNISATTEQPKLNTLQANLFQKTREKIPQAFSGNITASITQEELILTIPNPQNNQEKIQQIYFFPDQDGVIINAAPQTLSSNDNQLILTIQRGHLTELESIKGVLVFEKIEDNQAISQAFEINQSITANTKVVENLDSFSLARVLFLAFGGGILLNLMPCVFPVLSLKAMAIVQKAQVNPREVRLGTLAFTGGVLSSFTLIAIVLLLLRAFGQELGWGFQMQSPVFVALMAYLMFAVGLSFSGVFIFGASLMGIGQKLASRQSYTGEFFSGVFATLVATPCTAPFMATAITAALTQPFFIALAIFQLLALGMALPYILICLIPGWQKLLPKPGAWMENLQQFLAFPMYGATAWLVWVLTQQAGTTGLAVALTGIILISFAVWLYQKTRLTKLFWQRFGSLTALAILGLVLTMTQLTYSPQIASTQGLNWQPYTPEKVTSLRQSGTPVFVNFTASWCITCLVNERLAFNQPEAMTAFKDNNVALFKADWTSYDPVITKALESFNRSGVPLYVLYPADLKAEPIILPQVLNAGEITKAVKQLQQT